MIEKRLHIAWKSKLLRYYDFPSLNSTIIRVALRVCRLEFWEWFVAMTPFAKNGYFDSPNDSSKTVKSMCRNERATYLIFVVHAVHVSNIMNDPNNECRSTIAIIFIPIGWSCFCHWHAAAISIQVVLVVSLSTHDSIPADWRFVILSLLTTILTTHPIILLDSCRDAAIRSIICILPCGGLCYASPIHCCISISTFAFRRKWWPFLATRFFMHWLMAVLFF